MARRQFIQPTGLANPGTYTHVVTAEGGKVVFIAGQVAQDANGQIVRPEYLIEIEAIAVV